MTIPRLQVKIALCQFKVTPDKQENLETAKRAIKVIFDATFFNAATRAVHGSHRNHIRFFDFVLLLFELWP